MAKVLTAQADDFPRWYQDVVAKAEHVEGFSPELAVVTHGGGRELDEPVVVRPTSETIVGEYMAKWVQSYRDLPLLLNSWNNVVVGEMRTRLFLRTTEFLWQEGHTAHADREDARAYAVRILYDVYEDFMVNVLAMPVLVGPKTASERFPGAINTLTCEAMMRDGKALQMGTSHELGQNFAKAFDITYSDAEGGLQHCWTTSWGSTTRMVGGLIMAHGDDDGLVVPPALAPIQAVILVVKGEGGPARAAVGAGIVGERAAALADELAAAGLRVRLDDRVGQSFGRRATDWELKGVPVRVEVGPRDVAAEAATVVRRDTAAREQVPLGALRDRVEALVAGIQADMLAAATSRRDGAIAEVSGLDEAAEACKVGWARLPWRVVRGEGEARLAADGVTVRCLQRRDGSLPASDDEDDLVAFVARAY